MTQVINFGIGGYDTSIQDNNVIGEEAFTDTQLLSKAEIISRLTSTEKVLVWSSNDETVKALVVDLVFADEPLDMVKVTAGFTYLVTIGLLEASRVSAILNITL